ncbi:MAG: sulfite exporter TauE/SafE family protein [Bdellovibrionia bacterium]
MIVAGYLFAVVAGSVLGMLGAGGSIMTVPLLVYFFSLTPILATTYSLLVVGLTAVAGAAFYWKLNLIDWKIVLKFAVPSAAAVLVVRHFVWPAIPLDLPFLGITKNTFVMIALALVMGGSAWRMFKTAAAKPAERRIRIVIPVALAAGTVTGLLGAGAGFIIVPSLHLVLNLPMRETVATSLVVIAINSLFGFSLDMFRGAYIDWSFAAAFLACTFLGVFLGNKFGKSVPELKLKRSFGLFVMITALLIVAHELRSLYGN